MPSTAVTSCYRIFGGFSDPRSSLADHPRGARFCGSFPGGWFVVALEQIRSHALVNLRSGERVLLPDRVRHQEAHWKNNLTRKCPVFIRAATMSAAPPGGGGAGSCVVAALTTGPTNIAFWRLGMDCWSTTRTWLSGAAEDLTFYDGWFYTVSPTGELFGYKVENNLEDGEIKVRNQELPLPDPWQAPAASGEIVTRYLLPSASGEDLLMVKRYVHRAVGTLRFQVFTLVRKESGRAWHRFYPMSGQVLFVERGCSKAFDTGNRQPGFVYFLDDVYRRGPTSVFQQGQYHCTDTGSFCCEPNKYPDDIIRCLPQEPASDSSPWIWYLH